MKHVFKVTPIGAPRQTRRDRWLNPPRPAVARYRAFKDELKLQVNKCGFVMPEANYHLIFYVPMPDSWSKKKKEAMEGKPHQQKPDKDNMEKAFLDTLCKDDSHIWDGRTTKYWSYEGRIEIEF